MLRFFTITLCAMMIMVTAQNGPFWKCEELASPNVCEDACCKCISKMMTKLQFKKTVSNNHCKTYRTVDGDIAAGNPTTNEGSVIEDFTLNKCKMYYSM